MLDVCLSDRSIGEEILELDNAYEEAAVFRALRLTTAFVVKASPTYKRYKSVFVGIAYIFEPHSTCRGKSDSGISFEESLNRNSIDRVEVFQSRAYGLLVSDVVTRSLARELAHLGNLRVVSVLYYQLSKASQQHVVFKKCAIGRVNSFSLVEIHRGYVRVALTVLVTLLNKRGAACDPEAHPYRIRKTSSKVGHMDLKMKSELSAEDSVIAAANAAAAISVVNSGGGGI
ncbi:hypothetical protein Tco_0271441 [Tanacetum coccineum]